MQFVAIKLWEIAAHEDTLYTLDLIYPIDSDIIYSGFITYHGILNILCHWLNHLVTRVFFFVPQNSSLNKNEPCIIEERKIIGEDIVRRYCDGRWNKNIANENERRHAIFFMRLESYLPRVNVELYCHPSMAHEPDVCVPCMLVVPLIIGRVLVVTGDLKLVELFSFKTISSRGRTNYTDLRPVCHRPPVLLIS